MVFGSNQDALNRTEGRIEITINDAEVVRGTRNISQGLRDMGKAASEAQQAARNAANERIRQNRQMAMLVRDQAKAEAAQLRSARTVANERTRQAERAARAEERSYEQASRAATRSIQQQTRQAQQASQARINTLRGEANSMRAIAQDILALGLVAGGITQQAAIGADSRTTYEASFRAILGSGRETAQVMTTITSRANEFGLELNEARQLARALLPSLKGNVAALDEFLLRAVRLQTLNPLKSTADAARAIQELFAGQERSIIQLFNINPNLVQQAKAQYSDVGQQLDFILEKMGATQAAAEAQATTFRAAGNRIKNSMQEALGQGIEPFRDELVGPASHAISQFFGLIQNDAPVLLTMTTSAIALTAALVPLTFGLLRLAAAYKTMQAARAEAALAGTVAPGGALLTGARALTGAFAIGAGVEIGTAGVRFAANQGADVGGLGRFEGTSQREALGILVDDLRNVIGLVIGVFARAVQIQGEIFASLAEAFTGGIFRVQNAFNNIDDVLHDGAILLRNGIAGLIDWLSGLGVAGVRPLGFVGGVADSIRTDEELRGLRFSDDQERQIGAVGDIFREPHQDAAEILARLAGGIAATGAEAEETVDRWAALREAQAEYNAAVTDIEKRRQDALLENTLEYNRQRENMEESYQLSVSRFMEDQMIARRRALANFQLQMQRMEDALGERLVDLEADSQKRINDLIEDANKQKLKAEQDFQEKLADLQNKSREKILEAAARLDARGVFEEQRRRREQVAEMTSDFQKEAQARADQLAEKLADERAAYAERRAEALAQFQRQREDAQENFQRQQALAAEDAQLRLARMQEDFQRQLGELKNQFALRNQETNNQFSAEMLAFKTQNGIRLIEFINAEKAKATLENFYQDLSLQRLGKFWNSVTNSVPGSTPSAATTTTSTFNPTGSYALTQFASGGRVNQTGPVYAHAGEYVLNPDTVKMVERMLGGTLSQGRLTAALAGSGGGTTVVEIGSLVLGDIGNRTDNDVKRVVKEGLMELFQTGNIRVGRS